MEDKIYDIIERYNKKIKRAFYLICGSWLLSSSALIVLENFNDNTIIKTPFRIYKKILGGDKKEFYKDLTFLEIVGSSYLSICLYYFTKTDYERKKEEINDIKDNNLEERLK